MMMETDIHRKNICYVQFYTSRIIILVDQNVNLQNFKEWINFLLTELNLHIISLKTNYNYLYKIKQIINTLFNQ